MAGIITPLRIPRGVTRKEVFSLTPKQRRTLLESIKLDWSKIISRSFEAESEITLGADRKWRALSPTYKARKDSAGVSTKILQYDNPALYKRYIDGIKINEVAFTITIPYPTLSGGASAIVHQLGSPTRAGSSSVAGGTNPLPRRRIAVSSLKEAAREQVLLYFKRGRFRKK